MSNDLVESNKHGKLQVSPSVYMKGNSLLNEMGSKSCYRNYFFAVTFVGFGIYIEASKTYW